AGPEDSARTERGTAQSNATSQQRVASARVSGCAACVLRGLSAEVSGGSGGGRLAVPQGVVRAKRPAPLNSWPGRIPGLGYCDRPIRDFIQVFIRATTFVQAHSRVALGLRTRWFA